MKKVLNSIILGFFLCLPAVVYAASIGEIETQGRNKFSVGADQEFLFDRDMDLKSNWYWSTPAGRSLETKEEVNWLYRTMAKMNYGVLDNLDLYVKLGTADFENKNSYAKHQIQHNCYGCKRDETNLLEGILRS
jgi:hypothetical protein